MKFLPGLNLFDDAFDDMFFDPIFTKKSANIMKKMCIRDRYRT